MPEPDTAGDEKIREQKAEIETLEIALGDMMRAYALLGRACAAAMSTRDLVVKDGTQKTMLKVYSLMDEAIQEAERFYNLSAEVRFDRDWTCCMSCGQFVSPADQSPCCHKPMLEKL